MAMMGPRHDEETDLRKPLGEMNFRFAALMKWAMGQQKYGPMFQGNPVFHFREEMLDAHNYVTVAEEMGIISESEALSLRNDIEIIDERMRRFAGIKTQYGGSDGGE